MTAVARAGARSWIAATRPKTLAAAFVPVLVGSALAHREDAFAPGPALLCLLFAVLVQIGTNFANDLGDFLKGADTPDRIGPTRAVASGAIPAHAMARATALTFLAAFGAGLGLIAWGGWILLPVGLASLLFGWAYTCGPYPLAYHGLGDVFVFVFFGLVAVGGTTFVMTGTVAWRTAVAAVPVGLLATNLLVVNNHRDAETDARAGKRTLIVRFGRRFGRRQYLVSLAGAAAAPAALALTERAPALLLPALVFPFGLRLARRLDERARGPELNSLLADSAKLLLAFGLLWAAALAFG